MIRQVTYGLAADDEDYFYPESDGKPMSDNTLQYRWIVLIKENLEILFAAIKDVFIAGDLLWYPVQKAPGCAPDVMVVFGRPKGERGSYLQWEEGNIPPQVVFEILSPSNSDSEMDKKRDLYEKHGVEEYYLYDPETNNLQGWSRSKKRFKKITNINGWTSPRLKIRFVLTTTTLDIYRPDGRKFLTSVELEQRVLDAEQQAELEKQRRQQAEQQAELERQRYQELLKQLQDRGIEL
jgi:Uma2 family endonuclease